MSRARFAGDGKRNLKRLIACASVAALAASMTACAPRTASSGGDESGETNVNKVAIVTPETEADHGWNQQGMAGARAATKKLGIELDENLNVGYDNTQTTLTQVGKKDNQLVIAHASGFTTAAARASRTSGAPMLVVDNPKAQIEGQVGVVTFEAQQGGYLAGIAAAMTSEKETIGLVLSAEDLNWFTMSAGFIQGARSISPDIEIILSYVGANSYADSAGGKKVANQVIAAGADVIMGMGDGATVGYLSAIENAPTPVKYIATIGDVSELVKEPETVLTSVRWNFENAYVQAIEDVENSTFAKKPYNLTLANDGFNLQNSSDLNPKIQQAVEKAKKEIEDGSIKVERAVDRKSLSALLKQ